MRGAPPRGLASAILHTKYLSSRLIPDRPDRLRRPTQVQNRRNPPRCQPTTVSGRTTSNDFCQFGQNRARQTQNQRSVPRSRGLGRCLFITASCCRRARFSKVNSLRRAGRTRRLMTENQSLNMHLNIRCSAAESQFLQADVILTNQCDQRRLACSVGVSPTRARVRSPVAWVASAEETRRMKPTDKAILGMVSESPGCKRK
jgi:hypothetical protein